MITAQEVNRQLKDIGVSFWFFGNPELRQLRQILVDGEVIEHCILGRYTGGFAVLCATNLRLLLIDKKPFFLTLEDVRYDMIVEIDFSYRMLDSTILVCSPNKTMKFTAFKKHELRLASTYIQQRVIESRQQTVPQQQFMPSPQPVWRPEALIQQTLPTRQSLRNIAQTAIGGSDQPNQPVSQLPIIRQAVNPYARSSFVMRQRISRF